MTNAYRLLMLLALFLTGGFGFIFAQSPPWEEPDPMEEEEHIYGQPVEAIPPLPPDSLLSPKDTADAQNRNWWYLFKRGKLSTSDTTVQYPKFLGFCMKVYRWADKAFNSYDTLYVQGTGRRWKARLLSDNWNDSYYLNPGKRLPIRIVSDPYSNIGAYLQYMAVSVGYSLDLNSIIAKNNARHRKLEYTFSCARFNIEGHWWQNYGETYIRSFSGYNGGRIIREPFDGVRLNNLEVYGYYFFNNRRFSMGAAYNFSKFQLKSAGSAVLGFGYSNTNITLDLTQLPTVLKPYLTIAADTYKFHYRSYYLISGYSFNWVWNRHLLFNVSAFPGVGINFTYADNSTGQSKTAALNIRGMASLTYNLKDFFVCGVAKIDGNWYVSGSNILFSSVQNAQVSVGIRF